MKGAILSNNSILRKEDRIMRAVLAVILCGLLLPSLTVSQTIEDAQKAIGNRQFDVAYDVLNKLLDNNEKYIRFALIPKQITV